VSSGAPSAPPLPIDRSAAVAGKGKDVLALDIKTEQWPLKEPFRITNYLFTHADVVVVTLREGELRGCGEASGVYYHDETPDSVARQIADVRAEIESGINRETLRTLLPPGGARNALDCALWDLEAKRTGTPVWALVGLPKPKPLQTTFTLGAGTPDEMAKAAIAFQGARAIKMKLTAENPADCVRAVRAARPDVWIGVDANQGFARAGLEQLLPVFRAADIGLIEQPLPIGVDAQLEGLKSSIPIAADESAQQLSDIEGLLGRYDVINIKLDKCGGLTEGIAMVRKAKELGLKVMVGCMNGTSLAMAPAFLLGQLCDFVDLDSPVFLEQDREHPALYSRGEIFCPDNVWGGA
jgi:L-alanine-DL-glutamate epimerase-like enolase superfamily enzyme